MLSKTFLYLLIFIGYQFAGMLVQVAIFPPIPGAILGMLLLLVTFRFLPPSQDCEDTAHTLIGYLPLLFIPAGAGILAHLELLADDWLPLLVAVSAGSALSYIFGLFCVPAMLRLFSQKDNS